MTEQERRRDAARQLFDRLAITTEHREISKLQAYRQMCEAAIMVYDGTEDEQVAEWAREFLRILDEQGA